MRLVLRALIELAAVYAAALLAYPHGLWAAILAAVCVGAYGLWCWWDGLRSA